MPSVPALLARSIHTAAAVSPRIAGDIAYRLFFTTTPRMAVREADAPTHADARRGGITVGGVDVATYEWGAGPRTLLLLHGWRGRASQFAPLVRARRRRVSCHRVRRPGPRRLARAGHRHPGLDRCRRAAADRPRTVRRDHRTLLRRIGRTDHRAVDRSHSGGRRDRRSRESRRLRRPVRRRPPPRRRHDGTPLGAVPSEARHGSVRGVSAL